MNQATKKRAQKTKKQEKKKAVTQVRVSVPQHVNAPASIGTTYTMGKPSFRTVGSDMVIEHSEFCGPIYGSVAFACTGEFLNAGNNTLFTWLSCIAQRFESYQFELLEFYYEPFKNTSIDGVVYISIDYNPNDPLPGSVTQIMSSEGAIRTSSFVPKKFVASRTGLTKRKSYFVSGGYLEAGTGENLYDSGTLNVATMGQPDTTQVGELYVKYRVRLMTPELETTTGSGARTCRYNGTSNTSPVGNNVLNVNGISTYMPLAGKTAFYCTNVSSSSLLFTCLYDWSGYLMVVTLGNITAQSVVGSAGSTITASGQVFTSGVGASTLYIVKITSGQTITITTTNTTITLLNIVFAEGA